MQLHIFGFGYLAQAVERLLPASYTTRATPHAATVRAIEHATHLLITAPPAADGDPCLAGFGKIIAGAVRLQWIGYCSSTGVYGDRQGATVTESTRPAPQQIRSIRRLAAEQQWRAVWPDLPLDILRLAGIYGPGRSVFNDLRAGLARRIIRPTHKFSRIHRDDAARAVAAAMLRPPAGARILHLADDLPAPSAEVLSYGAALLNLPEPPALTYEEAEPAMSPMARSFWSESRLIDATATKQALGLSWLYPTYREGLEAILAEESHQQSDIGRA